MTIKSFLSIAYAAVALISLSGCVPKEPLPPDQHYSSSAIDVPFIAPRSELCASTSIEMISSYWQSAGSYRPLLTVQELDGRTLIPAKGGTLQIELVAAARANGLIVYPLEPNFEALFSELFAHHPVIVLVNRSYSWYPLWHYAPVTGYNDHTRTVSLHFSDQPNEAIPIATFAALWQRSNNWGVILLPPQELPVSVSPKTFLRAVYEFEKRGKGEDAIKAYRSAHVRWPENTDILFALGNAYYNAANIPEAEKSYRKLLTLKPTDPLALNNLSMLLCRTGRSEEAIKMLDKSVTGDIAMQAILQTTRKEISMGCTP